MDEQEKALALETLSGLLEGVQDLFNMALDNVAPSGYEIIVKKSGTDDFVRERSIKREHSTAEKWTEAQLREAATNCGKIIISKKALENYVLDEINKAEARGYQKAQKDQANKIAAGLRDVNKNLQNRNHNHNKKDDYRGM